MSYFARRITPLCSLLLLAALLLGACTGETLELRVVTPSPQLTPSPQGASTRLELASWWTSGAEAEGLQTLLDLYSQQNPGVEALNATPSAASEAELLAVLASQPQGGASPDSWQLTLGKAESASIGAGRFAPLTSFYREQGFDKTMQPNLAVDLQVQGEIYMIPLQFRRTNLLWYNSKIFQERGLSVPTTLDEFFRVAEQLKSSGITPLAVGAQDPRALANVFDTVLLATLGLEFYGRQVASPPVWGDPLVVQSIELFERMLAYSNADRATLAPGDAAQLVLDGKAAMTIMADWVAASFAERGAALPDQIAWTEAPGTRKVFLWYGDGFSLASGAANRENALAWLRLLGSKEAQQTLTLKSGATPARIDVDPSAYSAYGKWSIQQFNQLGVNTPAPSLAYGAATPRAFSELYRSALQAFSNDLDEQRLLEAFKQAAPRIVR